MNKELIVPNHIGIIMDGNGRWAQERGLARTMGHKKALENLKEVLIHMADIGVKYASLYAFSTENFKRDVKEVNFLMNLFIISFKKEFNFLKSKNVKVVFSGRREPLSEEVLDAMDTLEEETKENTDLVLNICLNYGGQAEIVDMTKKICEMYKSGSVTLNEITPEFVEKNLYRDLPPLDFVIRTSGELRLSNFMLFQAAYAEFYFPEVYFPDFDVEEFDKAIEVFNKRNRRFGGVE